MARYIRLEDFSETTKDDPKRGIWYAANVDECGFWTDDWDSLGHAGLLGIPSCPNCGYPGLQIDAENWYRGAKRFEENGHPYYVKFLDFRKNQCGKEMRVSNYLDHYYAVRNEWIND